MNRYNNNDKDLYQIIGINKDASQELIIQKCEDLVKKDVTDEVGIASLVLSDPKKREEYNKVGWKEEWGDEWRNRKGLCNSVFEAIHDEFKKTQEGPEAWKYYVMGRDLDPTLWAPFNSKSTDADWIEKNYSIVGANWRQKLEDFRDKMIAAIRKKYQENKQNNPSISKPERKYEYKEKFNCGKCGKHVEMFPYCGGDGKRYCSFECLDEAVFKLLRPKFEEIKTPPSPKKVPYKEDYKCVSCHKKFSGEACVSQDQHGNEDYFCSDSCRKKGKLKTETNDKLIELKKFLAKKEGTTHHSVEYNRLTGKTTSVKKKHNPFFELLNWMKKEGIVNIFLNASGNLVIEYSGSQAQVVNDNNLTNEQKEIKEFFQQVKEQGGDTYLNQKELENFVNSQKNDEESSGKQKNGKEWITPALIIGMGAIILILIGVIIYKNKKKGY